MDPAAVGKKRAPRFGCGNRLGKSRSEPFIVPCGVSYDSPSMNHPRRMLLLALPCVGAAHVPVAFSLRACALQFAGVTGISIAFCSHVVISDRSRPPPSIRRKSVD